MAASEKKIKRWNKRAPHPPTNPPFLSVLQVYWWRTLSHQGTSNSLSASQLPAEPAVTTWQTGHDEPLGRRCSQFHSILFIVCYLGPGSPCCWTCQTTSKGRRPNQILSPPQVSPFDTKSKSLSLYLEGSESRVAVVDGGGQQALPALRVIFVR